MWGAGGEGGPGHAPAPGLDRGEVGGWVAAQAAQTVVIRMHGDLQIIINIKRCMWLLKLCNNSFQGCSEKNLTK